MTEKLAEPYLDSIVENLKLLDSVIRCLKSGALKPRAYRRWAYSSNLNSNKSLFIRITLNSDFA